MELKFNSALLLFLALLCSLSCIQKETKIVNTTDSKRTMEIKKEGAQKKPLDLIEAQAMAIDTSIEIEGRDTIMIQTYLIAEDTKVALISLSHENQQFTINDTIDGVDMYSDLSVHGALSDGKFRLLYTGRNINSIEFTDCVFSISKDNQLEIDKAIYTNEDRYYYTVMATKPSIDLASYSFNRLSETFTDKSIGFDLPIDSYREGLCDLAPADSLFRVLYEEQEVDNFDLLVYQKVLRTIKKCFEEDGMNHPPNIEYYNNIAFYLQQMGADSEALSILESLLEKFPERTVAHLNAGDAYWDLGEKEKAKKAYQNYVDLMRKSGKKNKVPQQVVTRLK